MITRDQFIRGFNAIVSHYDGRTKIETAMFDAGWEDCRIGYDPVVIELQHQLEERCNDVCAGAGGTMIDYALNEGGECSDPSVGLTLKVDSAEAVWRWWEETKTGPFEPTTGRVLLPRAATDVMVQGACRTHTPGVPMSKDRGECPSFDARRRAWSDMVDRAVGAGA
ncbi:hypothetical protein [Brevundimonas vesicularis]|uniref:Uncharacterized protein n=1 Tax=Brevundimonas vesicularis TaxID=41276 RepID=A0A1Z3U793_BREVE|nr:hypothetical protein [Brevundimonas vesicularis]ASE39112.1 hypothetical protein CEP68_06140 [Brevundimonas vesicularis]